MTDVQPSKQNRNIKKLGLFSWDYTINHNKSGDKKKKIDHIDNKSTDLDLDMDTDIVNIKSVSVSNI